MNWIDTQFLVYAAVEGHPARHLVEQELSRGAWGSSVLVLLELYHVLARDYAVAAGDAAEVVGRLARSPFHWAAVDGAQCVALARSSAHHRLAATDAALLTLAERDGGTLVSQDRRLLRAAAAEGVAVRNPIGTQLAGVIARWEDEHLPAKGLPRLLGPVERWLRGRDPALADQFLAATGGLSGLP